MNASQRARKIAAARRHLDEAVRLLDEVAADHRDTVGRTLDETAEWRAVVSAAGQAVNAGVALHRR